MQKSLVTNKQKKQKQPRGMSWVSLRGVNGGGPVGTIFRRATLTSQILTSAFTRYQTSRAISTVEWSSLSAIYTLYRVTAMRLRFVLAAGTSGYVLVGGDRSGVVAAPTLVSQVWALQNARVWNFPSGAVEAPTYEMKALELEDQNFLSTTSSTPAFAIQVANETNGTITVLEEYMLEFRGNV
jgi:hypothetical protein